MERENPTLHNRDIQLHETKCYLSNITSSRNKHTGKLKATLLLQTLSLASLQGLLLCINGLPRWQCSGKESACQCKRQKKHEFDPWVRKIPWRRTWQPSPVFVPGESPWKEEPGGLQPMGSQTDTVSTHVNTKSPLHTSLCLTAFNRNSFSVCMCFL